MGKDDVVNGGVPDILARLTCLTPVTQRTDYSKLPPNELHAAIIGNLYVIRDILEQQGLLDLDHDLHDYQVAEMKIRLCAFELFHRLMPPDQQEFWAKKRAKSAKLSELQKQVHRKRRQADAAKRAASREEDGLHGEGES